jgi:hypothetical protein
MLSPELQALAAGITSAERSEPLPRPVSPLVAQIDGDSWCAEGRDLQSYVVASSSGPAEGNTDDTTHAEAGAANGTNDAWELGEASFTRGCDLPNCPNLGYQAKGKGIQLDLQIDLSAATSPSGTLNRRAIYVFFMSGGIHLQGGREDVGTGQLTCVSGCKCRPMLLDGFRPDHRATVATNSTEVSQPLRHTQLDAWFFLHQGCYVRAQFNAAHPPSALGDALPADIAKTYASCLSLALHPYTPVLFPLPARRF